MRVPADSIRVDGRLDETIWRDVPALTDFVQREPVEGAPPTDRMEVRFAYDDNALDFYGEPFAASGRFDQVGELAAARSRIRRLYGTEGTALTTLADGSQLVIDGATSFTLRNRDFNVESFRSNLVLRWEWRAGSTLYLVQQDRSFQAMTSTPVSLADMFSSLGRRGDNFFAIKTTFWFSPG